MKEAEVATKKQEKAEHYDVYVFQKRFALPEDFELAKKLKGLGKKIIFDLCDAEWANAGREKSLLQMIDLANALTASTKYVADWMTTQTGKEVAVIPDRIDLESHELITPPENEPLIVGWYGNKLTLRYLEDIASELNAAHEKVPFKMRVIWENERIFNVSDEIETENITWKLKTVNQEIGRCDIIINPHGDDALGKGKSNNKTITAWALGRPVLEEDFAVGLPIYLRSATLRYAVGLAGRKDVIEKYDVEDSVNQLRKVISSLL